MRWLAALILFSCPFFTARADDDVEPARLTLYPAAEPKPSLKYRLLPVRRDLEPGNAAAHYYRAFAMFVENRFLLTELGNQHWSQWVNMPVNDLPLKEVRQNVSYFRSLIREIDLGTRRKDCDWMLENRSEGLSLLLPEIQGYRNLAAILSVRARVEMIDGKWVDAVETLRIGLALGKHMAAGPSPVHFLVGASIVRIMLDRLEEMMQQPEMPNLYWALSVLPNPMLDPSVALDQSIRMIEDMFPSLKRLEAGPISTSQVSLIERDIDKMIDRFQVKKQTFGQALQQAVLLSATYPEAKTYLIRQGVPKEDVDAMPIFQVVVLFAFRECHEAGEETLKWWNISDHSRHPGYGKAMKRWAEATVRLDRLFFRNVLNAVGSDETRFLQRIDQAQKKTDRRIAALRIIEALRIYGASHEGKLPASLDAIKEVPIPLDPATGKPFAYELEGDKAILSAEAIPEKGGKLEAMVYVLRMKR